MERRKNWGYMQHGIVIWLDGPAELLAKRACKDGQESRPLLGKSQEVNSSCWLHLLEDIASDTMTSHKAGK